MLLDTLYIPFSVICVMQIISALQADTYINVNGNHQKYYPVRQKG